MKELKIMQSFPEKWNEPTFLEFAYDNYGVWWRCRIAHLSSISKTKEARALFKEWETGFKS
jgi:hypothetical protein